MDISFCWYWFVCISLWPKYAETRRLTWISMNIKCYIYEKCWQTHLRPITHIYHLDSSVCDRPLLLFLDIWVTRESLGPYINQQPHAEFITTCHLLYTLSLIRLPSDPDRYSWAFASQSELLKNKCLNAICKRCKEALCEKMMILTMLWSPVLVKVFSSATSRFTQLYDTM